MTAVTNAVQALSPDHFSEIIADSAIDPGVAEDRGYRTVYGSSEDREELTNLGFSSGVVNRDDTYPALLIPLYRATGEVISHQLKPADPRILVNGDGKPRPVKYENPKGSVNHIDVPRFTQEALSKNSPLWITEGVKKTDCLVSNGRATIGITGVYNWRRKHGTLGDWEDIPLKGRSVVICFDSDASENRNVQLAMRRLGAWLQSKGCSQIHYLIVPSEFEGTPVKGVDDWFAAGGDMAGLQDAASLQAPGEGPKDATFTDAFLTETVAEEVLEDSFCWARGLGTGWLMWTGFVWKEVDESRPTEAVRAWVVEQYKETLERQKEDMSKDLSSLITGWRSVLSKGRIKALVDLSRGVDGVNKDAEDFDADPDLLCVKNGYVDLRTGTLYSPDPQKLMTRCAGTEYEPDATHPLWEKALSAVPEDCHEWFQDRIGQGVTGYMTPDDLMIVSHGDGENGKSTVVSSIQTALGKEYARLISDRILMASPDAHPTELMDLRGARIAFLEETPEARRLDVHRLKKTVGTEYITARHIRQNDVTFKATHGMFVNTNFRPVVTETDHGTWRRLALLSFPYCFRKPGEALQTDSDRPGDPRLRAARTDPAYRRAVLAWAVRGARAWYARDRVMLPVPRRVEKDTGAWRAETDLIMGFASDMLSFFPDGRTPSKEMLDAFNKWSESKGHKPWTDRTFSDRFAAHDVIKMHRVVKKRVRPQGAGKEVNAVMTWIGVTLSDDGGEDPFTAQTGTDPTSDNPGESTGVQGVQGTPVNEKMTSTRDLTDPPCTPCTPLVRGLQNKSDTPLSERSEERNRAERTETVDPTLYNPAHRGQGSDPVTQREEEMDMEDSSDMVSLASLRSVPEASVEVSGHPGPITVYETLSAPVERPDGAPVGFDLEARGKDWLGWGGPGPYVTLAGHGSRVDNSPERLISRMREGGTYVGHSVYGFDLPVLERHHGLRIEETYGRIWDTRLQGFLADPPTSRETKSGPHYKSYSLDALGQRILGREKDSRGAQLAAQYCTVKGCRHGKKSTTCNGWENIDPSNPDYALYCHDDVSLVEDLHDALPRTPYMEREMKVQAIMAKMTVNGLRVDEELLSKRIREGEDKKQRAIDELSNRWGMPGGSKSPLATKLGKEWLASVYKKYGVTNPPRTPKKELATGKEVLKGLADHPKCPEDLRRILGLMGVVTATRTIYQTIKNHTHNGYVHPDIWPSQASGRWSMTDPGLTVMGKRGALSVEREVILPDEGEVILTVDLSQIDARIVAAHAQDPAYLALFEPGKDLHSEVSIQFFGSVKYRPDVKAISHLANYGGSQDKLISMGFDPKIVRQFFKAREENFPGLLAWQENVREQGYAGQILDNGFGRPLRVEASSAYTQAPAQIGQGGTRDMMAEGLLRLVEREPRCWKMLRAIIHDEVVLSVPVKDFEEISRIVVGSFECEWAPSGSRYTVPILAEAGSPGKNWADAYRKE